MNYKNINPILHKIEPDRQGARRHYGVHPYFTRRPYNVVRDYIKHYTNPGDKVLDPFGGSGVTAIESYLLSRTGIQNDINPLANFISDGLYILSLLDPKKIQSAIVNVIETVSQEIASVNELSEKEIEANWGFYQNKFDFPPNVLLPRNSDVVNYHDLFTKKQIISLAVLKSEIDKLHDEKLRHAILLVWSATLSKINKTFLSTEGRKESRGGSSIFSIYRYKVANNIVELNPMDVFKNRSKNIIKAQKEIIIEKENANRNNQKEGHYSSMAIDATELDKHFNEQIDYIFTDPPYGAHIAYLDLSTLWNIWLNKIPDQSIYEKELIVGGDVKHSEEFYITNLSKSINTMAGLLKPDRWFSIVFQHKNVKYFEAILESAFESGCNLSASIPQDTGIIWSMHKKKGKHSVLAGELILTFQKVKPKYKPVKTDNFDFEKLILKYLNEKKERIIISEEEIFNDLVVLSWNHKLISDLNYYALDIPNKLRELGFDYDSKSHNWKRNVEIIQKEMF